MNSNFQTQLKFYNYILDDNWGKSKTRNNTPPQRTTYKFIAAMDVLQEM